MATPLVRRARTADVRRIRELVDVYAGRVLLAKETVTLYESVPEFLVAELDGEVVGCGALHVLWEDLGEIRTAYELISDIVTKGQDEGSIRPEIEARFAAMVFYGAIEQLLTGWIFGLLPRGKEDFERAKRLVVESVCGGLEPSAGA